MPAVKKELPGREDLALALAAFRPPLAALPLPPLPGYPAPLPAAAALPPAASLPAAAAGYGALLAPPLRAPRACLSLPGAAAPARPPGPARLAAPDFQPLLDRGEPCIEVECGANRALLYVRKLCQGSKGPSIRHRGEWLTPNEFQFVSGRETAKDWKRSIRHKGKSLKTLVSRGILQVHPPICDCPGCRISSPVNRGRLADKRTVALPPTRVLKKELTPSFSASDADSDGSSSACGRLGLKREGDPHVRVMKRRVHTHWDVNISFRETSCSQDPDLPALVSSVHRSRHLVMPERRSRCEFQQGGVEPGPGASGELLGKRLGGLPPISSDCPVEKARRSQSPQEALLLSELGPAMAPEDHYRRLVTALSEASSFQDHQRLYHLGVPGPDLLRARQEAPAAGGPGGPELHLRPPPAAAPRRKPGLAERREGAGPAAFADRELSRPPPLPSPQNAPHIALGPHLRPPFLGVSSALCQAPGYGFLPPTQAEALARQQELLRKHSLARLEMSAELLRQELESVPPPQLLAPEAAPRPESTEELQRRGAMLVLGHSSTPLLALPPQGTLGPPTLPHRVPHKGDPSPASAQPGESEKTEAALWAQDSSEDESPKDSDGEDPGAAAAGGPGPTPGQAPTGGASSQEKGLLSGPTLPPPSPLGPGCAASACSHTGASGGFLVDGEAALAPEDISKWTVDNVCSFVGGLPGCGEYVPVFREQGIDGEALALLTEEHLLTTLGLKLGPALKIRAQVARRLGRIFYMASFPVALPLRPPQAPEREPTSEGQPLSPAATTTTSPSPCGGEQPASGLASPKPENRPLALLLRPADTSQTLG